MNGCTAALGTYTAGRVYHRCMRLRVRDLFFSALVSLLVLVAPVASAQQAQPAGRETSAASVAHYALSQQMPVDPEAIVGALPNGLHYYVRANA